MRFAGLNFSAPTAALKFLSSPLRPGREPSRKGRNSPLGTMSFAPGRPGAKKSKEQAKKDKDFAEAKLRMLERAEKNLGTLCMRLRRKSRTHARACVPVCVCVSTLMACDSSSV